MVSSIQICLWSVFVAICGTIHHLVSQDVKDPFIDEIFHLNQCFTYCEYKFDVWDNKITTPPGLYVLGFVYAKVVEAATSMSLVSVCGNYDVLRSVNLMGGLVVLPLILLRFKSSSFWVVNIVSMPLLFSYYFLFYTDVWSLVLIIGSLAVVDKKSGILGTFVSGVLGFLSLWFRQTNIIWIGFIAGYFIDSKTGELERIWTEKKGEGEEGEGNYLLDYITNTLHNIPALLPYGINFILFAVFLKVNGGITFGDKENHEVQIHLVQVFYCFTFINLFTVPTWLSINKIKRYIKFTIGSSKYFLLNIIRSGISSFLIFLIIDQFTIVHPFLLADNRHYTFYLYRRILSHPFAKYFMVPIYHFCGWNIYDSLRTGFLQPVSIFAYFMAIVLTVVPSPLFEPRYYIVPLIVFRIFVKPENTNQRNLLEFIYLNAINGGFFMVFFNYEFTWDSEPDIIQRIIW